VRLSSGFLGSLIDGVILGGLLALILVRIRGPLFPKTREPAFPGQEDLHKYSASGMIKHNDQVFEEALALAQGGSSAQAPSGTLAPK
jgi:hypothetical protein